MLPEEPGINIKRQRLTDAASKLFSRNGYRNTTVRLIAEKAGLDSKDFFYCFESKEDILNKVIEQLVDEQIENFGKIAKLPIHPAAKLGRMAEGVLSFRNGQNILMGLVSIRSMEIRVRLNELVLEKGTRLVAEVISEGIGLGAIRNVEPESMARMLLNNMLFLFDFCSNGDAAESRKMVETFCHIAEASLGIPEGMISAEVVSCR